VLTRLSQRQPDIDVEVDSDRSRQGLLSDLAEGRLEAALLLDAGHGLGGLGFPAPARPVTFIDLDPVPLALVAAPAHALATRAALTHADLRGERLLVNVPECSFWMAADRILGAGPARSSATRPQPQPPPRLARGPGIAARDARHPLRRRPPVNPTPPVSGDDRAGPPPRRNRCPKTPQLTCRADA
jgi:hypothetical protein